MISPVSPFPDNSGGRVRINKIFTGLSNHCHVTLIAPARGNQEIRAVNLPNESRIIFVECESITKRRKIISGLSIHPYHFDLWYSRNLLKAIDKTLKTEDFDLVYCHFAYTLPYVDNTNKEIVCDLHNIDSDYWERKRIEFQRKWDLSGWLICYFNLQKLRLFERRYFSIVEKFIAVSKSDSFILQNRYSISTQKLIVAPNGVDSNRYRKINKARQTSQLTLGFLGSMDLQLNEDAVFIIVKEIYPAVREMMPDVNISVLVIGKNPSEQLKKYIEKEKLENVTLTGTVNDVLPHLQKVDVLLLPLRSGAGSKLRVFEAMASGVPIIGSKLSFIGIEELEPNIHMIEAETSSEFVEKIIFLYKQHDLRERLSERACELITSKYDWSVITARLAWGLDDVTNKQ